MRFNSFFAAVSIISLLTVKVKAQDCVLSVASLSGKNEGGCKKGKADGMGKAVGEDSYEGAFRSGLPDGKGKYTWKNGDWYDGEWYKGMKQGPGTMSYKIAGNDSSITGFWKKDKYIGLYEKPYIVYKNTIHVTNISCQHVNNSLNQVELFLNSVSGGINTVVGQSTPKPEITDIQIITGNYMMKTVNDSYAKKIGYRFEQVTFPFRAIYSINYGKDMFELEISESGKWTVEVNTSL